MEGQFQSSKSGSGPVNWKQMLTGKITVAFKEANLIEVYINDVELDRVCAVEDFTLWQKH